MRHRLCALQAVCDVAATITSLVPSLSASHLTAVTLQMAATNVPADSIADFYAACVCRAHAILPQCSVQQLADLSWAFCRAAATTPRRFHTDVRDAAGMWATAQLGCLEETPLISRESAHEAANFLFRLTKAQLLRPDGHLSLRMLFIVAAGAKQVRLLEHQSLLQAAGYSILAVLVAVPSTAGPPGRSCSGRADGALASQTRLQLAHPVCISSAGCRAHLVADQCQLP